MSKVDLSIFDVLGDVESKKWMIYYLCEGDFSEAQASIECEYDKYDEYCKKLDKFEEKVGYEHLAQDGGGEGGAEDCYGVFKFMGKYYRADYGYRSHEGCIIDCILDSLREVTPKEKMVTVYE